MLTFAKNEVPKPPNLELQWWLCQEQATPMLFCKPRQRPREKMATASQHACLFWRMERTGGWISNKNDRKDMETWWNMCNDVSNVYQSSIKPSRPYRRRCWRCRLRHQRPWKRPWTQPWAWELKPWNPCRLLDDAGMSWWLPCCGCCWGLTLNGKLSSMMLRFLSMYVNVFFFRVRIW